MWRMVWGVRTTRATTKRWLCCWGPLLQFVLRNLCVSIASSLFTLFIRLHLFLLLADKANSSLVISFFSSLLLSFLRFYLFINNFQQKKKKNFCHAIRNATAPQNASSTNWMNELKCGGLESNTNENVSLANYWLLFRCTNVQLILVYDVGRSKRSNRLRK